MAKKIRQENRYSAILEAVFAKHYTEGALEFEFERGEIEEAASRLQIVLPKNIGDLIYSFRYRVELPNAIRAKASTGNEWIIGPAGRSRYVFKQVAISRVIPRAELVTIKIPDATPEIVLNYTQGDEQALLAKVRYNRLVDIFLGLTTYSLQNHLRTTVKGVGQIEIDELYIGLDRHGSHYVIPVQAKGGKDQLSVVQAEQDIACCKEKSPTLVCRAISAQFMDDQKIAMFELVIQDHQVKIVDEKHYKLLPAAEISPADLLSYRKKI